MEIRVAPPPFTITEVLDALGLVMPADVIDAYRQELSDHPGERGTFSVTDGTLLLLAAKSEELAERVVAYRPDLRGRVAEVRADPERYIESVRPGDAP